MRIVCAKSLYISRETEFEIWAGFRPAGSTEHVILLEYLTFEGGFFIFSWKKEIPYTRHHKPLSI